MNRIPLLDEVTHVVVHRGSQGDGFLHGAAIVQHAGTWYASWGSSPVDENSLLERECGRRARGLDGARRWGPVEVIGPNLDGAEARSHGVFHVQDGILWSLVPRFGRPRDAADEASTVPRLVTDAFRLDPDSGRWELYAEAVAHDFWPMDAPTRLPDGRWIMGGLSGRQNAVVATSARAPLAWERTEIPRPAGCDMQFAETSVLVWPQGADCTAVTRYRAGSLPGLPDQLAPGLDQQRRRPHLVAGRGQQPAADRQQALRRPPLHRSGIPGRQRRARPPHAGAGGHRARRARLQPRVAHPSRRQPRPAAAGAGQVAAVVLPLRPRARGRPLRGLLHRQGGLRSLHHPAARHFQPARRAAVRGRAAPCAACHGSGSVAVTASGVSMSPSSWCRLRRRRIDGFGRLTSLGTKCVRVTVYGAMRTDHRNWFGVRAQVHPGRAHSR